MQKIVLVWGKKQETMPSFGTADDAMSTQLIIDVTAAEARIPGAVYSIHMRRADGWIYPAAVGLHADLDCEITYTLEESDLAATGALWVTVRADAAGFEAADGVLAEGMTSASSGEATGEKRAQWSVIGWVSPGLYEGTGVPKPDWVSEILAFANAFGAISARIALLPPNARPAAAFVQEADGMKLALSLPDTSGIGDGGHAIFSAQSEEDLLTLTDASIGDQAITAGGDVYMCIDGDPTEASAWVRLSEDTSAMSQLEGLIAQIDLRVDELSESVDALEQSITQLGEGLTAMEQTVDQISETVQQVRQADGLLKSANTVVTAAELGVDYAIPPTVITAIIEVDMWDNGAVDVTDERILENTVGLLRLSSSATADEYTMYANAKPRVSAQWDGGLTVSLSGETPDAPLPLEIVILN
ncbi:hypothetical protein FACS1894184_00620 [Clostridia bacterium]|nr:hypothetical protein FACS1894184_00620 [Clostridia bacterium]